MSKRRFNAADGKDERSRLCNDDEVRGHHDNRFNSPSSGTEAAAGMAEASNGGGGPSSSSRDVAINPRSSAGRRLQKELMTLARSAPEGIKIDPDTLEGSSLSIWKIELQGPGGTLYEGETFHLQFKFGVKYPFDSPEVTFVGDHIPVHPHIYSNGHICLSILTEDWSPALSVETVCLSITSMLASAKEKKLPPDNSIYIRTCSKNPKKTHWWYHDDTV